MVQKGYEWDGNGVPPLVEVVWEDCQGKSGWLTVKKAFEFETAHCQTMGYLLEWNDQVLRMSGALIKKPNGLVSEVANTDVIPAGWVVSVAELIRA